MLFAIWAVTFPNLIGRFNYGQSADWSNGGCAAEVALPRICIYGPSGNNNIAEVDDPLAACKNGKYYTGNYLL